MYLCTFFLVTHSCLCMYVCMSARAKVLTSIKYTITLYMYINMRNRGYSRDLRKGVSLCKGREEKRAREIRVSRLGHKFETAT